MISKLDKGIIVIIRNPKKELRKKESPKNKNQKKTLKEYGIGAQILVDMGIQKIILLTNSKTNIIGIDGFGLKICGVRKLK